MPYEDFDTNATGTLNMLEATRRHLPEAVFIQVSTNKIYGDAPNHQDEGTRDALGLRRPRYERHPRGLEIDRCTHSLFGASKLAGDIMRRSTGYD